jgi:HD-GYP domain-containing protein (c-di-GMP phosphodiesterase class II)
MEYRTLRSIDFHDVIECLIAAVEARDSHTSGHSTRVADLTLAIAQRLGIEGSELETIHMAAHMHDIGKIGLPDDILSKPGRLTQEEWALVRRHPEIGCEILQKSEALRGIARIVLHHHERWDGKGYPAGLRGEEIPLGARIIAVADSIDAMISERPYRAALSLDQCAMELAANRGRQFDPEIAGAALELLRETPPIAP